MPLVDPVTAIGDTCRKLGKVEGRIVGEENIVTWRLKLWFKKPFSSTVKTGVIEPCAL